jgi:hypothetical protein
MKLTPKPLFLCVCFLIAAGVAVTLLLVTGSNSLPAAVEPLGANSADVIALPKPDTKGGKPLMEALSLRQSTRAFKDAALPAQELANLLWACWGVNRPDGRHTVPTSQNKQNVAVYAALANGVWRYDAAKHELVRFLANDTRALFGGAPLTLLYAAEDGYYASGMHVGSLYQNVGLYCASAGLGNVVKRNGVDALDGVLKLPDGYRMLIVQSVGYPR